MNITLPPKLNKGDKVALISSARKVNSEEIHVAVTQLQIWGLEVCLGKNIYAQENQFAGSDEQRSADLQNALDDESIHAILFARGGYGTIRIIDKINFDLFKNKPKWLIGFSDITILHSHIHTNLNIATLHAPMAFNFQKMELAELEKIKSCLFARSQEYEIAAHPLNKIGNANGVLIGGNLSILYSLLGSRSDLETKGKILFLEDLDEYLYHIDRIMFSLKRNGKLRNIAGLIIGGMNDMKDNAIPFGKNAEEIISEAVKGYSFPVCFGFPSGHLPSNVPLILGDTVSLSVSEVVRLKSQHANGTT